MRTVARRMLWPLLLVLGLVTWSAAGQQNTTSKMQVDKSSVGGVVVNTNGGKPEAGVWVIAETKSLPAPFRKIVVTDEQGRFLVPDMPAGSYELWVRGYGLRDSERTKVSLGGQVKLQVSSAATPQEAAKIYPASTWVAMIHPPAKDELPKEYVTQEHWLTQLRGGCNQCHQLGMAATRRYTNADDWDSVWQRNAGMNQAADKLGRQLLEKVLVDWANRIQAGEVPPMPARPTGMERNFVVSQWDWGAPESFFHDVTSTDKRNPTLYANGKVYGADRTGGGRLWVLDPTKNTVEPLMVQPRISKGYSTKADYYHDRESADDWMASPHNPMLDEHGRVWMTQPTRPPGVENNPKWSASTVATESMDPAELQVAAKILTARNHGMQLGYYDTKTNKFVGVDTSYSTHHLQFDWQGRIWTDGDTLGMLDTTKIDLNNVEGTEAAAQKAWMRVDMDTQKAIPTGGYATAVSPIDGVVWLSVPEANGPQNKLWSLDPKTRKFRDYPLPLPGRFSHGIDFSSDGNVWISAESGHLGRLDPKTGKFTFWDLPGPKFTGTGMETGSTEAPYFLWVDQFDTLGLGKDTVIVTGTTSDAMLIFDPRKESWSVFHMPYPIPFYTRGLDGRIDDAKTGWKGRGIWATYSSYMPKFTENRSATINHIQYRPNPLAN